MRDILNSKDISPFEKPNCNGNDPPHPHPHGASSMPRGVGRNFPRGVVLNVNLMVLFALVSALTLYAGNVKHLPPKRAGRPTPPPFLRP